MRNITLASRTQNDWSGKFVDDHNYDLLVNEDARVLKPDGSLLCVLRKRVLPIHEVKAAWGVLKDDNFATRNRGTASGVPMRKELKKDGTYSNTMVVPSGFEVQSGVIGFMDRNPRYPYCRACAWNLKHPEKFAQFLPMAQSISRLFEQEVPDRFAAQKIVVDASSKDFVLPETVYTTVTVNKNFRTACHLDAGDLPEGFSAMALIRSGKYTGGRLVFPDFRVAVELDTSDVIFFDPHEYHGNTPIHALTNEYVRCTLVFYYREGIKGCLSAAEELERAKNRKLGESLK